MNWTIENDKYYFQELMGEHISLGFSERQKNQNEITDQFPTNSFSPINTNQNKYSIEIIDGGILLKNTKPGATPIFINTEKLYEIGVQLQEEEMIPQRKGDNFLKQLRTIIEENYSDTAFGVEQLEKLLLRSYTQIYRKIKKQTGKTPSQFIRKIRLQKGLELLKKTDLRISEIAYDIGFSDPNYFSRSFQKEYGLAPRDIRRISA